MTVQVTTESRRDKTGLTGWCSLEYLFQTWLFLGELKNDQFNNAECDLQSTSDLNSHTWSSVLLPLSNYYQDIYSCVETQILTVLLSLDK